MRPFIISVGADSLLHDWAIANDFSFDAKPTGICIYRGLNQLGLSEIQDQWLRTKCFERIFEFCYLPSQVEGELRAQLVRILFSEIGATYYSEAITLNTNIDCYNTLFQGALSRNNSSTVHILDVGCGPGTILKSIPAQQATSLTGFDFVETNCIEASKRGMTVVDVEGLAAMPTNSFDILLCSFVLHYETLSDADIYQLVRVLRPDGVWAANFHKSKGLARFMDMLKSQGNFTFEQEPSHFGQLVFARSCG